jgi:hypothetical protein
MPGKTARSGPQRHLDGLECRRLAGPSVLGLPAIQKIPNFHVRPGFIWGIPVDCKRACVAEFIIAWSLFLTISACSHRRLGGNTKTRFQIGWTGSDC